MVIDEHGHEYEAPIVEAHPPTKVRLPMGGHGAMGSYFDRPPLSQNDRTHFHVRAKIKRQLRDQVTLLLRAMKVRRPAEYVVVQLVYRPATRRYPDPDNLAATTKVIADALQPTRQGYVDKNGKPHPPVMGYGLIPEDTQQYVSRPEAKVLECEGRTRAGWWVDLTITYPKENQ